MTASSSAFAVPSAVEPIASLAVRSGDATASHRQQDEDAEQQRGVGGVYACEPRGALPKRQMDGRVLDGNDHDRNEAQHSRQQIAITDEDRDRQHDAEPLKDRNPSLVQRPEIGVDGCRRAGEVSLYQN